MVFIIKPGAGLKPAQSIFIACTSGQFIIKTSPCVHGSCNTTFRIVPREGLEPSHLTALVPKTSVYTVPPPGQIFASYEDKARINRCCLTPLPGNLS